MSTRFWCSVFLWWSSEKDSLVQQWTTTFSRNSPGRGLGGCDSRMRTACFLPYRPPPPGQRPPKRNIGPETETPPQRNMGPGSQTYKDPLSPEQNDWHAPVKILPCTKLRLRAVKIYNLKVLKKMALKAIITFYYTILRRARVLRTVRYDDHFDVTEPPAGSKVLLWNVTFRSVWMGLTHVSICLSHPM